ncbi:MAG: hypothetical protein ACI83I_001712 [Bacteroidia bacterium]|jgi:hypothetical protein
MQQIIMRLIKPLLIFVLSLLINTSSNAQLCEHFTRLECRGIMPSDFSNDLTTRYEQDVLALASDSDLPIGYLKDFMAITNLDNERLLMSGLVTYGDPISQLCNRLLDTLLKDQDSFRNSIRAYTIKSNSVNAFATFQGMLFVTTGLIARLETEGQLAFILAHEISHLTQNHIYEMFKASVGSKKKMIAFQNNKSKEDDLLAKMAFSRENEFEADDLAIPLLIQAGYPVSAAVSTIKMLIYSYLPIEEQKMDYSVYEDEFFKIPASNRLESVTNISKMSNLGGNSYRTHPSLLERMQRIQKLYITLDTPILDLDVWDPLISEIRDLARFEMVNSFMKYHEYPKAIYHIGVLKRYFPTNEFLIRAELWCWANMQAFSNNLQKRIFTSWYKNQEGELQETLHWFGQLSINEINCLATRIIWLDTVLLGDEKEYLKTRSMRNLVNHGRFPNDFFHRSADTAVNQTTAELKEETNKNNVSKARKKAYSYCTTAFVQLFNNGSFTTLFDSLYALKPVRTNLYYFQDLPDEYIPINFKKNLPRADDVPSDIGTLEDTNAVIANRILVLNPSFTNISSDENKRGSLFGSINKAQYNALALNECSELLGLDLIVLGNKESEFFETAHFNDYVKLLDFVEEKGGFSGKNFKGYFSNFQDSILSNYQTNTLLTISVDLHQYYKPINPTLFLLSALLYPTLPIYVFWQFRPENTLYYQCSTYSLNSGQKTYSENAEFRSSYKKDVIKNTFYRSLSVIYLNQLR